MMTDDDRTDDRIFTTSRGEDGPSDAQVPDGADSWTEDRTLRGRVLAGLPRSLQERVRVAQQGRAPCWRSSCRELLVVGSAAGD